MTCNWFKYPKNIYPKLKIGSTVRESCGTEPTNLTNYTNTMSITLLNSTVDQTNFRNSITGLVIGAMANNGWHGFPSVPTMPNIPTPLPGFGPPYPMPHPVIVVQPPQQIYLPSYVDYMDGRPQRPSKYKIFNYDSIKCWNRLCF